MVRQSKQTVRNTRCSYHSGPLLNQPHASSDRNFAPRSLTRRGTPIRKRPNTRINPPQRNPLTPPCGPAGSTVATNSLPERPISRDISARRNFILCPDCTCSANYRGTHTQTLHSACPQSVSASFCLVFPADNCPDRRSAETSKIEVSACSSPL